MKLHMLDARKTWILGALAIIALTIALSLLEDKPSHSSERILYSGTRFSDISKEANITERSFLTWGNPTLGDFNGDGYLDFLVPGHYDRPSFYLNNKDGTFRDIENALIASFPDGENIDRHGFAVGDYNNDGILDLYVAHGACRGTCTNQKQDELLQGDGTAHFTDITNITGTTNSFGRARSAYWVDYNNDGLIDLFVLNLKTNSVLYRNNGDGTFTDVADEAGLQKLSGHVTSWADYNNDGYMDLLVTGNRDILLKNNGNGTFTDVTIQTGLKEKSNGRGIAWGDYNNDGYFDLFIARGYEEGDANMVWNSHEIVFLTGFHKNQGHTIDFVTDGKVSFDLYIRTSNFLQLNNYVFVGKSLENPSTIPFTLENTQGIARPIAESDFGYFISKDDNGTWHVRFSDQDNPTGRDVIFWGTITTDESFTDVSSSMRLLKEKKNTLYRNDGGVVFTDVTKEVNLEHDGNHETGIWGDYDNDGWLDLYVVDSGDISEGKPDLLYRNNRNGTFTNVSDLEGVSAYDVKVRHGSAAWGDFDNDGFLDLVVKNGSAARVPLAHGSVHLYKNYGNVNHWLELKLVGQASNRLAIGTTVKIDVNGDIFYRQLNSGGGGDLFSQSYSPLHFGLGSNMYVDHITINWPSGFTQKISNVQADQIITINELDHND